MNRMSRLFVTSMIVLFGAIGVVSAMVTHGASLYAAETAVTCEGYMYPPDDPPVVRSVEVWLWSPSHDLLAHSHQIYSYGTVHAVVDSELVGSGTYSCDVRFEQYDPNDPDIGPEVDSSYMEVEVQ